MKEFEVICNQENIVIGKLVNKDDEPLLVDALTFIRNWKPESPAFKFIARPKLGTLLKCPRCNGMLSIKGSCSLNGESLDTKPDGLLIGQFTIE